MSGDAKASRRALGALALAAGVTAFWLFDSALAPRSRSLKSYDLLNYYLPVFQVTFERAAAGELPLWNPFHLTGIPWLATLQAGVFYPPRWLYAFLPANLALAASHVLHLVLIAVSMAALARKAGLGGAAAALAAVPLVLRGTTQWWLQFPSVLEAGAWLPLGGVAVLGIARGEGRRAVALLAFTTGMSLLAGYTQATVFCVVGWGTLLLASLAGEGPPLATGVRRAGAFAAAIAVGAAIGAVQVLPTFELTLEGTRTTEALSRAQAQTVGGKASFLVGRALVGSHVSLGATLLVLAPAALCVRRHRALALGALALGLGAYALAVGTSTSLIEVYRALPVVGWFRNPRRLLFLTNFALALLAAISVDGMLRRREGARATAWVTLGVALAVGVWGLTRGEAAMGALAAAFGLAAAITVAGPRWVPGVALAGAWLALAVTDAALERSDRGRLPYDAASADTYRESAPLFRQLAASLGPDRATWIGVRLDRELKLAPAYGVRLLDDYEPLNLRRHSEYFTYLQHGTARLWNARGSFAGVILPQSLKPQTVPQWEQIAGRRRLLDLASTRGFLVRQGLARREAARAFVSAAGLDAGRAAVGGWTLFENPHALPRAFVTYRAEPAPETEDLLRRLADPGFDPMTTSLVETDEPLPTSTRRGHPVRLVRDETTVVEIEADLAEPGLVVLSDAYMRGWKAFVDGEEAPVLPTNHLFRGVRVPAGAHRVRFDYRPTSVRVGGALSAAGVLGCLVLPLARRRGDAGAG